MTVGSMVFFGMNLFMLLEVLGSFERLATYLADVRLQRSVNYIEYKKECPRRTKRQSVNKMCSTVDIP
jgi:hypothetical protein